MLISHGLLLAISSVLTYIKNRLEKRGTSLTAHIDMIKACIIVTVVITFIAGKIKYEIYNVQYDIYNSHLTQIYIIYMIFFRIAANAFILPKYGTYQSVDPSIRVTENINGTVYTGYCNHTLFMYSFIYLCCLWGLVLIIPLSLVLFCCYLNNSK